MKVFTRLLEIELHRGLLYVRVGSWDACVARGQGLVLGGHRWL